MFANIFFKFIIFFSAIVLHILLKLKDFNISKKKTKELELKVHSLYYFYATTTTTLAKNSDTNWCILPAVIFYNSNSNSLTVPLTYNGAQSQLQLQPQTKNHIYHPHAYTYKLFL